MFFHERDQYLGRGWTFDDLEEATAISANTHCCFFKDFISWGSKILFQENIVELADDQSTTSPPSTSFIRSIAGWTIFRGKELLKHTMAIAELLSQIHKIGIARLATDGGAEEIDLTFYVCSASMVQHIIGYGRQCVLNIILKLQRNGPVA
jgi:hypothetical protein